MQSLILPVTSFKVAQTSLLSFLDTIVENEDTISREKSISSIPSVSPANTPSSATPSHNTSKPESPPFAIQSTPKTSHSPPSTNAPSIGESKGSRDFLVKDEQRKENDVKGQKELREKNYYINNPDDLRKKRNEISAIRTLPPIVQTLLNTKESSRVKCRFKIEKKYVKLNKKEKDFVFKLTPFTMVVTFKDVVFLYNVQGTLIPSLILNQTLLIRIPDSSAREELKHAIQENVTTLVRQLFLEERKGKNVEQNTFRHGKNGSLEGYLIRSNVNYRSVQNVVYQRPSIVYARLMKDELLFYKTHDMYSVADVVASRFDMRMENVIVRPMAGNTLGFEILVNNDIREQFITADESERNEWIQAYNVLLKEFAEERQILFNSAAAVTKSHGSTSVHSSVSNDEESSIFAASEDDSVDSASVNEASPRSSGSYVYHDSDSVGEQSSARSTDFEEPDFFSDPSESEKSQQKNSLFSAEFWNGQGKRARSMSSHSSSQVDSLQKQLDIREQEMQMLRAKIESLNRKLNNRDDSLEEDNDEPDFLS